MAEHELGDALSPAAHRSITEQTYDPVLGAITPLLAAGKREGVIRADADPATSCSSPPCSGGPRPRPKTARSR
jgi:hypothetical protein